MANLNSLVKISNSLFSNFAVSNQGGVIYLKNVGNIILLNNTFINNTAYFGGAIYYENSDSKLNL